MKKFYGLPFIIVFLFALGNQVDGQDIHLTQYDHSFRITNPALTGLFDGEHRIEGNFRRQWKQVPVDYVTFSGSYDSNVQPKNSENSLFGYGLSLNYDRAGYSKLSLLDINLLGSYSHFLNPHHVLTVGLNTGFNQRSFRENDLSWDQQYQNGQFNENLPTGENLENMNLMFFNLAAGVNYRFQNEKNTLNIGGGFFNITKPKQNFFENTPEIRLPIRSSLYVDYWLGLSNRVRWNLTGNAQWQGPYEEQNMGTKFEFQLIDQRGSDFYLSLGSYVRLSNKWDAVSPYIGARINSLDVGFSYDINVSGFNVATDQRGGPEVWVRYIIKDVDKIKDFKTCRIY